MPDWNRAHTLRLPALCVAAAIALLLTLDWLEEPEAGAVERLADLLEILVTVGTAAAVAWWVTRRV